MLESTREPSYLNFGKIFLSALLQKKLYENSRENSLFPRQQIMDEKKLLIELHERTSMWITCFFPISSKIIPWTLSDQLPTFWNFVEVFSLAFCLSHFWLIS